MNHTSIEKDSVFHKQLNTKHKKSKCSNCSNKADAPAKMKRLKTRKERSMRRHSGGDNPNIKLHHHDSHGNSQDFFYNCCHSRCQCSSQNELPQEPSIITTKRLIGHHSRFNHEVKSIDIERLLTEKMREGGQKEARKGNTSPSPHRPSVCVNERPASDDVEIVPFEKLPDPTAESHDDCQENIKELNPTELQATDKTPGKTSQQKPGSDACIHSKHETNDKAEKGRKSFCVFVSGNVKDSQVTPSCLIERAMTQRINVTPSPAENSPELASPSVQEMKSKHLPARQINSSITMSSGKKHNKKNGSPDSSQLSECVRAAVRRVCGIRHFPLLKRRDLEAESKNALMKALQERHGPRLHENLKELQRVFKLDEEYVGSVQHSSQKQAARNEYEADPFSTQVMRGSISQSFCGSQENTYFKMKGKKQDNWKAGTQILKKTTGWFPSKETSANLLEDLFRKSSPQFHMNFDPAAFSTSDQPFTISPNSPSGQKTSEWDDLDVWPKVPNMSHLNFFDSSFMSNTGPPTQGRSRVQPFSTQPTTFLREYSSDPNSTDLRQLFPNSNPFFATSSNTQQRRSHQSSAHSFLSSHQSHMLKFPRSPMLEKASSPSLTSLLSPEPWAFPPMRLY